MNFLFFALLIVLLFISFQTNSVLAELEQPEEVEKQGSYSLILQAILDRDFEALKNHIENGENLAVENSNGWGPVRFALEMNDIEALKYVLQEGADINVPDIDGATPLIIAAQHVSY